jgi:hypothetical protein
MPEKNKPRTTPSGDPRRPRRAAPRFDLVPTGPLARLAARYELGARKYGEGAWLRGLNERDVLDHAIAHLLAHRDRMDGARETGDDDLAGAAWGCLTLMHYQDKKK